MATPPGVKAKRHDDAAFSPKQVAKLLGLAGATEVPPSSCRTLRLKAPGASRKVPLVLAGAECGQEAVPVAYTFPTALGSAGWASRRFKPRSRWLTTKAYRCHQRPRDWGKGLERAARPGLGLSFDR